MKAEVRPRALKPLLELAHRLRKLGWKIFRPKTRGVKVMLFNRAGELMLIRNSYGSTELWVLPGGGIRPFERPEKAAAREVKEELGCEVEGLTLVGIHCSAAEGKRDTVHVYKAIAAGEAEPDGFEVQEARFFPLVALPETVSGATLRRIDEHRGLRRADGLW